MADIEGKVWVEVKRAERIQHYRTKFYRNMQGFKKLWFHTTGNVLHLLALQHDELDTNWALCSAPRGCSCDSADKSKALWEGETEVALTLTPIETPQGLEQLTKHSVRLFDKDITAFSSLFRSSLKVNRKWNWGWMVLREKRYRQQPGRYEGINSLPNIIYHTFKTSFYIFYENVRSASCPKLADTCCFVVALRYNM